MDMNLNYAQCIKTSASWGHDTFYNICNGATHVVPWGGVDYIGPVIGIAALAVLVTGVLVTTYAFIKEVVLA